MIEEVGVGLIIGIVVAVVILILLVVTIILCVRSKKKRNTSYKKAPIIKVTEEEQAQTVVNISETNKSGQSESTNTYFGASLSEIPFIDDSKYSSHIDLTRNPYQPLIKQST